MLRLKITPLLLAVFLAVAVLPAAAHAAPSFKAGFYPATLDASGGQEKFMLETVDVACETTSYHGEIEEASTTLALTPAYSGCKALEGSLNATITTTGCSYVLHVSKQTAEDEFESTLDVVCEEGKAIKIAAGPCKAEIPPQTGLKAVALLNDTEATPKRDITFTPEVSGMTYKATDEFLCPFNGSGTKTNGSFTASSGLTLTGQSPSNPETKIGVEVGEPPVGPPSFRAGFYPATPHGSGGQEKFALEAGNVECTTTSYDGELKEASTTLSLAPTYSSCKAFGFEATVTTIGCTYVFHIAEQAAEDKYAATLDIACEAGKAIKVAAGSCEAEIPAQTGLEAVELVNDTEATPKRDITFRPEVGGLAYTVLKDGFLCPFKGTGAKTGGSFTASSGITLTGQIPGFPEAKVAIEVA